MFKYFIGQTKTYLLIWEYVLAVWYVSNKVPEAVLPRLKQSVRHDTKQGQHNPVTYDNVLALSYHKIQILKHKNVSMQQGKITKSLPSARKK